MKKIRVILATIICVVLSCFALTSCGDNTTFDTNFKFINIGTDNVSEAQWIGIKFSSSKVIKGVYINVAELGSTSVSISGYRCSSDSYSETTTMPIDTSLTKEKITYAKENNDGWIKLNTDDFTYTSSSTRYKLIITGGITLNEMVFLDADENSVEYTIEKADIAYYNANGDLRKDSSFTSTTILSTTMQNGSVANLYDEQDKFVKPTK